MTTISWLHLTDLHMKATQGSTYWTSMRTKFHEDIKKIYHHCGPWDLVLFTGDITYSGLEKEFEQVNNFLNELWSIFGKLNFNPHFLAIPGNHDLVRLRPIDIRAVALKTWHTENAIRKEFWEGGPKNQYRKAVNETFRHFSNWRSALPVQTLKVKEGILPGDFSVVFDKQGIQVGIIGLNSTFLQLTGDDYEGKLDLDPRQIDEICTNDVGTWTQENHINILMTHHPPSWLHPQSAAKFRDDIAPPGRFCIHLFRASPYTLFRDQEHGRRSNSIDLAGRIAVQRSTLGQGP